MGLWGFLTGQDAFSDGNRAAGEWFNQGGGTGVSEGTVRSMGDDFGAFSESESNEFCEGFLIEVDRQERLASNREKGGIIGWLFGG